MRPRPPAPTRPISISPPPRPSASTSSCPMPTAIRCAAAPARPSASFMAGQWGSAGGATGYPGSIWKVDGDDRRGLAVHAPSRPTAAPGLGDLVFDPGDAAVLRLRSRYRPDLPARRSTASILDTFDHGVDGRPAHELDAGRGRRQRDGRHRSGVQHRGSRRPGASPSPSARSTASRCRTAASTTPCRRLADLVGAHQ